MSPGNDSTDGPQRAQRLAKNEAFFHEANELLEREEHSSDGTFDCICECSRAGCVDGSNS